MGKIRLNLASGAVVEKPLVNAFKSGDNSYLVLDNEMNGSMGLPIILVSKLSNNKLVKIVDTNEWQQVKEYLKNIIAGNTLEYITVSEELAADDIYYTQLTLPIPSFDALKNAYKIDNQVVAPAPVEAAPVTPEAPETPDVTLDQAINSIDNVTENASPVVEPPKEEVTPDLNFGLDLNNPAPEPRPEVAPVQPAESQVVMPNVEPEITPTPVIEPHPVEVNEIPKEEPVINTNPIGNEDFKAEKEAFMQACENMFDALVQKFENRK